MLRIGQSVFVEGGGGEGLASVAAYRSGHYVMLDTRNLSYRLELGATVNLRVFHNGSYLNYRAENAGYLNEVGLVTLTTPKQVDVNHRRSSKRYFLNLPIPARVETEPDEQVLLVKDLSAQGVRFVHESFYELETSVTLRFAFGRGLEESMRKGRIVRRDELPDSYAYGVLFDEPEDSPLTPFGAFLSALAAFEEYATPEVEAEPLTPAGQSLVISIGMRNFISRIRGYRNREWLITDIPSVDGAPITAIRDGEIEARVRFLRDGVASGFKATLNRQYTSPAPVWVWGYPEKVERSSVRRSLRFRTALHTDIEWDGGYMSGMMLDISDGGGRLVSAGEGPGVGDIIKLAMHLSNGQLVTGVIGDIRCVNLDKGKSHIGLSFRREDTDSFNRLSQFLGYMVRERSLQKQA